VTRLALATAGALAALALPGASPSLAESADYLYRLHCGGCHGLDGRGSKAGGIPPFQRIAGHFLRVPEGRDYLVLVPGVANAGLSDEDTARVLNHVLRTWSTAELPAGARDFTREEVGTIRRRRIDDIVAFRRRLAAMLARRGIDVAY